MRAAREADRLASLGDHPDARAALFLRAAIEKFEADIRPIG
jgi:hypothetical protein